MSDCASSEFGKSSDFSLKTRAILCLMRLNFLSVSDIEVAYELEYSIYNGCKDMDIVDSEELRVFGGLTEEGWAFDEHVPPPKRDTVEEY